MMNEIESTKVLTDYEVQLNETYITSFVKELKINELRQLDSSTNSINPNWKGTNKTPKTDLIHNNKKYL